VMIVLQSLPPFESIESTSKLIENWGFKHMNVLGIVSLLEDTEMDKKLGIIVEINHSLVIHAEK
jgi:hypothetical protein